MGHLSKAVLLCTTLAGLASTALVPRDGPSYNNVTYPGQKGDDYDYTGFEQNQTKRADAVIEMFRFAWNGYYSIAFPNDDLLPVTSNYSNSRNGWGVTAVDGLDTAIIMEQTDIVNQILEFIPTIDFTKVDPAARRGASLSVSLFETTIRYVGGLLASYDLLKGPFSHLDVDADKVEALLTQCVSLADTLKFAFNTTSGIPVNNIFVNNGTFAPRYRMADGTWSAGLAELGACPTSAETQSTATSRRKP
jgi:mannosyl-oligosaccharide alpha-1,2-mannosidase